MNILRLFHPNDKVCVTIADELPPFPTAIYPSHIVYLIIDEIMEYPINGTGNEYVIRGRELDSDNRPTEKNGVAAFQWHCEY